MLKARTLEKKVATDKKVKDKTKGESEKIKKNRIKKEQIRKYGQFYTKHPILKDKIYEFILNEPTRILEPCIGRGDLVVFIKEKIKDVKVDMYEIDKDIVLLDGVDKKKIEYGDFLKKSIEKKYKTIIGNPPYIRTPDGNTYIQFIIKCYKLLEDEGELIFVVPSDFLKLTSMLSVLNDMMKVGTFTHIFHPNNEKLFDYATIDVIVFRYCKTIEKNPKILYNGKSLYISNNEGLLTFGDVKPKKCKSFDQLFDIYVGLVTGRESVYKNKTLGNIDVINGDKIVDKYIFTEKYPSGNKKIDKHLLSHKKELIERKIRKFNEKNWFEWGALRNIKFIREHKGKDCIYIHTITRKKIVAFAGKVGYFGSSLIILIPKAESKIPLAKVLEYLNSESFMMNYMFAGRFKIGHTQLSGALYPC